LFQDAKLWGCRPSQLVAIEDPYKAYCFDEAVGAWGSFITSELEKIEGKTDKDVSRKRKNRLLYLLDAPVQQRFRSFKKAKGKT